MTTDVGRFREVVGDRLGLCFDDAKLGWLAELLDRRADAMGVSATTYVERLENELVARGELRELARQLTVAETYFFRHIEQFRAFTDVALPDRLSTRSTTRKVRILSAGCASGEEAYSLAILVRERGLTADWEIAIRGVDINTAMLEKASRATYSAWSLRETPAEIQRRWFAGEARGFSLDRTIAGAVVFEEKNLASEDGDLWVRGAYDVVFCRNVIMYFSLEVAQRVVARIARALAPGGYLFLGHAETLRGLSHDFHLRHTHDTFYYQRKDGQERGLGVAAAPAREWASPPPAASDGAGEPTWIETVRLSAERVHALTASSGLGEPPGCGGVPRGGRSFAELSVALELLREERYSEALGLLATLPSGAPDPERLLLHGVLSMHAGDVAGAEATCARLLELDELNAGARYVLALCRESAGDAEGARDHDRIAAYLDPSFSMPRLHLGLLARRAGEIEGARRELTQAIALLEREDGSRLLLFGGGFGREGLIALCRAELGRLKGKG